VAESSFTIAAEPAAAEIAMRRETASGLGAGDDASVSASIPDCGTSSITSSSTSGVDSFAPTQQRRQGVFHAERAKNIFYLSGRVGFAVVSSVT